MSLRTEVLGSDTLTPLASIAVRLPDGTNAFVVKLVGDGFVAYRNRCPHWNVDLDMGLGDFVDPRTGFIECRNHGAEFEVATGRCVSGPCAGDALSAIDVLVEGGRAVLVTAAR